MIHDYGISCFHRKRGESGGSGGLSSRLAKDDPAELAGLPSGSTDQQC